MEIIYKYSPIKHEHELFFYFDCLIEQSGTIVILHHLILKDKNEVQLDIDKDEGDIYSKERYIQ